MLAAFFTFSDSKALYNDLATGQSLLILDAGSNVRTHIPVKSTGLFLDERVEDLERVNKVNFMGVIYTLKAGLPGLVERGSGRVLMISSMMAMYGVSCSRFHAQCKAARHQRFCSLCGRF